MYEYAAKLVRIIDGDTFVAQLDLGFKIHKIETVRLSGINTPESRTRNAEEKRHGLVAKKFGPLELFTLTA
jgi:endonuclease YncB( thermonuclease family)